MSKLCIECRSEIADGAVKCIHCSAYRTWRRHIRFSGTFLLLLVALVSMSGLVVPSIGEATPDPDSDLSAQVISIGDVMGRYGSWHQALGTDPRKLTDISYCVTFSVSVRNEGGAPGFINRADIRLHAGSLIAVSGSFLVPSSDAAVEAKESRVIDARVVLAPAIQDVFPPSYEARGGRRTLELDYSEAKVTLHFVRSDGTKRRDEHVMPGHIDQVHFEEGSC